MTSSVDAMDAAESELALPQAKAGAWWAQGMRAALLLPVHAPAAPPTPALLFVLWLVPTGAALAIERLMIPGPANFYAPALLAAGWLSLLLALGVSWALGRDAARQGEAGTPPLSLLALLLAQSLPLLALPTLLLVSLARDGAFEPGHPDLALARALWMLVLGWVSVAQALLLWRAGGARRHGLRVAVIVCFLLLSLVLDLYSPLRHWYPARPEPAADTAAERWQLTPEMFDSQATALQQQLQTLAPQRKGRVDVYALTFSPNADEEVFGRESAMVASVMEQRFGATGRSLQLVSRRDAAAAQGWATLGNLERALQRVAAQMNRDEDLLFIHLTSHGARDGTLAASFFPLEQVSLTPQRLLAMLDAAGVRFRVISVSACYAGSWIAPLSGDDTLVMTAADAEHTSYGCGRGSPLTYFGRAVFDEQLRSSTRSFEAAHAAAREVIATREKEAGKTDGYSNPQIAIGAGIRARLQRLEAELGAAR